MHCIVTGDFLETYVGSHSCSKAPGRRLELILEMAKIRLEGNVSEGRSGEERRLLH